MHFKPARNEALFQGYFRVLNNFETMLQLFAKMDQYVNNSIFSALMMTNLINDLLDQAKFENAVFNLHNEFFSLKDLFTSAFGIINYQTTVKNIDLILAIDNRIKLQNFRIYSDQRRLLQIVLNFLSNSLKFTKRFGHIKLKLDLLEDESKQIKHRQKSIQSSFSWNSEESKQNRYVKI